MSNFYLWIKALHILAIISSMAGMLYLPRLFVYHAEAPSGMRAIMLPALLVVWASGIILAIRGGFLHEGWFHAKFALVIVILPQTPDKFFYAPSDGGGCRIRTIIAERRCYLHEQFPELGQLMVRLAE